MSGSRALIDGDILVYRTGFAGQQTLWSAVLPDGTVVVDSAKNKTECLDELAARGVYEADVEIRTEVQLDAPSHVAHSLDMQLEYILDKVGTRQCSVFLTGSNNFRHALAKTLPYKGNRQEQEKPKYYDFIRQRLQNRWGAEVVQGCEADDYLAIYGSQSDWVICSIDKDLLQVPGLHYNWIKDSMQCITPEVGTYKLFCQVLAGDATDNIPNVQRGFGMKTAEKFLLGCNTYEEYCIRCHQKFQEVHGDAVGGDRFWENFNLVYLCRTFKELEHAKQAALEGGKGLSPYSVKASKLRLSAMFPQD